MSFAAGVFCELVGVARPAQKVLFCNAASVFITRPNQCRIRMSRSEFPCWVLSTLKELRAFQILFSRQKTTCSCDVQATLEFQLRNVPSGICSAEMARKNVLETYLAYFSVKIHEFSRWGSVLRSVTPGVGQEGQLQICSRSHEGLQRQRQPSSLGPLLQ